MVTAESGASDCPLIMLYEIVPACHAQNPLVRVERSRVLERRLIYAERHAKCRGSSKMMSYARFIGSPMRRPAPNAENCELAVLC